MSTENEMLAEGGMLAYVTRFDGVRVPATDYQPVWVANLADDVTIEGSAMNGVVKGAEGLVGEHFSGTPYGEHFASSAPE